MVSYQTLKTAAVNFARYGRVFFAREDSEVVQSLRTPSNNDINRVILTGLEYINQGLARSAGYSAGLWGRGTAGESAYSTDGERTAWRIGYADGITDALWTETLPEARVARERIESGIWCY